VRAFATGVLDPRPLIAREVPLASLAAGVASGPSDGPAPVTVLMTHQ
jgi:hypothetical protein